MAVMPFPTPPASDDGDVMDTEDCPGCRRIREREAWKNNESRGELVVSFSYHSLPCRYEEQKGWLVIRASTWVP